MDDLCRTTWLLNAGPAAAASPGSLLETEDFRALPSPAEQERISISTKSLDA